ncbi:MAG TPA: hypothetical protein VNT03_11720 [Baekduia sp.]|nr:hypothetical protein [Baekduia sp.]
MTRPILRRARRGAEEIRQVTRTTTLGVGTLACPACDAPVSPGPHRLSPSCALHCPFCGHPGAVRDFLTLGAPTRPAHVVVKVTTPTGLRIHSRGA